MNATSWKKEQILHADRPTRMFVIKTGEGEELAYTEEDTANRILNAHNACTHVEHDERLANSEAELREIDHALARRDALDGLPTRLAKILKAIDMAKSADPRDALGQCRDAIEKFLTAWDGAYLTLRGQEIFADVVRKLREARDNIGK